jgi:hypothetical protein
MPQYALLCRIAVEHAFWQGAPMALDCVPTSQTQDWLRRRDVLIRHAPNGVALWCETQRLALLLDDVPPASELLAWKWYARDPLFSRYTAPAMAGLGNLPLLRSGDSVAAGAQSGPGQRWLHPPPAVTTAQWQAIDTPALARHLDRRDALRPPVLVVEIDLADVAGAMRQDGNGMAEGPAGGAGSDATGDTTDGGIHYRVRFAARASFWKYLFLADLQVDPARLAVIDLDGLVRFAAAPPVHFPGGRQALVFVSDREIVMQQQQPQRFQLREQGGRGERVLVRHLPNADAGQVTQDAVGGAAALVSEIYVN